MQNQWKQVYFTLDQSESVPLALKSADPLLGKITASSIAKSKSLRHRETINLPSGVIIALLHIQRYNECPFSRTTSVVQHRALPRRIPITTWSRSLFCLLLHTVVHKSYKRILLLPELDSD